MYAKQEGYSTILLGRIGDDHYGKIILDSLNGLGISTQFVEVSKNEYTGISFEINRRQEAAPSVYFDPGASTGRGDFHYLLEDYLALCDVIILNQWLHPELSARVLEHGGQERHPHRVRLLRPSRDKPLEVDYLFLEAAASFRESGAVQVRKGLFLWSDGELAAYSPGGEQVYRLQLDRKWDGDYLAIRLMRSLSGTPRLEETASFAR